MTRISKTTYKLQVNGNEKKLNSSLKVLVQKGYISLKFCQLRSFNQKNNRIFDHSYIFFFLNSENPELNALQNELLELEIHAFYHHRVQSLNRNKTFRGFYVADPTKNLCKDKEKSQIKILPPNYEKIKFLREKIKNTLKCSKLRHSYNKLYLILLNIYRRQYDLELPLPLPSSATCLRKKIEEKRVLLRHNANKRRLERLNYYKGQIILRKNKSRQIAKKQQILRLKNNPQYQDFFTLCSEFLSALGYNSEIPDHSILTYFKKFSYETLINGINYLVQRKKRGLLDPIQNPFAYMYRIFYENVASIPEYYSENKEHALDMADIYEFVQAYEDYVTVGDVDFSYCLPPESFGYELNVKINFYLQNKKRYISNDDYDQQSMQKYYETINKLKLEYLE